MGRLSFRSFRLQPVPGLHLTTESQRCHSPAFSTNLFLLKELFEETNFLKGHLKFRAHLLNSRLFCNLDARAATLPLEKQTPCQYIAAESLFPTSLYADQFVTALHPLFTPHLLCSPK